MVRTRTKLIILEIKLFMLVLTAPSSGRLPGAATPVICTPSSDEPTGRPSRVTLWATWWVQYDCHSMQYKLWKKQGHSLDNVVLGYFHYCRDRDWGLRRIHVGPRNGSWDRIPWASRQRVCPWDGSTSIYHPKRRITTTSIHHPKREQKIIYSVVPEFTTGTIHENM